MSRMSGNRIGAMAHSGAADTGRAVAVNDGDIELPIPQSVCYHAASS